MTVSWRSPIVTDRLADQQGSPPEVIFTQETGHPDIAEVLVTRSRSPTQSASSPPPSSRLRGPEVLLVGVLKGAVMVMADLSQGARRPHDDGVHGGHLLRLVHLVLRRRAHPEGPRPLHRGHHVLVVEDIIDSGLTLSWLIRNLRSRNPASVEVVALLRKPEAMKVSLDVRYVGFDIPSAFVVGYGLDYAERYRTLPFVGTLTQEAIERALTCAPAAAGPPRVRRRGSEQPGPPNRSTCCLGVRGVTL